ncbi:MAG: hypothetical protein WDW38_011441 [Sanguina aurantia]
MLTKLCARPAQSRRKSIAHSYTGSLRILPLATASPFLSPTSSGFDFPHTTSYTTERGDTISDVELIQLLSPYVADVRMERIRHVVANRTFTVQPIVEGLYDMGNLAAVCRTCDALGFGGVHVINRSTDKYKRSQRTSGGAEKWLDVKVWGSTSECLAAVKAAGVQLVVTHLSPTSVPTTVRRRCQHHELSSAVTTQAVSPDRTNVAGALLLWEAAQQRQRKTGRHADLTPGQRTTLEAVMMLKSVREGPSVVTELLNRPPPTWQETAFKNWQRAEQAPGFSKL